MEEIYQTIIEYKNLYPAIFWGLVTLLSLSFIFIIAKFFSNKRNIQEIKPNLRVRTPQKPKSNKTEKTSSSSFKSSKIKTQEKVTPKENQSISEKAQKISEPKVDYKATEQSKTTSEEIKLVKKSYKEKEELPEVKKEPKKEIKQNLFVNYSSSLKNTTSSYPIFMSPTKGCIVRSHRIGSTKRRGYKEKSFQLTLEKYFSPEFKVSGDIRLNTGKETRPFEPDIAILDLESDKNIRIDIEIDEPYAGITRQATHCGNEDYLRDCYFIDRGWIVIRFSEYQVHTQLLKCLKFIADVISSIKPDYSIPQDLKDIQEIDSESFWDLVQAQKWERENYRENYLNHTFQEILDNPETVERDFDDHEIAEENLVEPSFIGEVDSKNYTSFNKENSHPRDKRIEFYPEPHVYTIDNVAAPSASTIVAKFFPEFDMKYWAERKAPDLGMTPIEVEDMWKEKGKIAREKGTLLHEQIEKYYLGEEYKETEAFSLFKQFVEDHSNLTPYRSEWRIFDDTHHIAGTIDLIVKNGSGFEIYDWKRSKKVINTFDGSPITINSWQSGIGQISHLDDTSYNRYCLQQSLYRFILDKNYGLKISKMFLVVFYPEYDQYYKVEAPYLKQETEYILNTL